MADLLTSDLPSLTDGDPLEAMDRIHEALMTRARDTIAWYDRHRDQQRLWARGLRMFSILLGSSATLLPMGVSMIHAYSPTARADALLPASSILALLAATCVLLDKFFGCSSSWMRFTTSFLELRSRAESFHFAWRAERLKLRPHADGSPAPLEVLLAAYALHQQFLDAINELVRNETRDWLLEFKGALAELERRVEEQRQSLPVPDRGALRLQLEGDPAVLAGGPWHLRLDSGEWIEQRGALATVPRMAPGIHSLEVRVARPDGTESSIKDVVKIEPSQIQEKIIRSLDRPCPQRVHDAMRTPDPHVPDQSSVLRFYDGLGAEYGALRERGFLGWLARRDIKALWDLLGLPAAPAGLSALDVGCGAGLHTRLLAQQGLRVCAMDLSPRMVEAVRPHVAEALVGDVDALDLGRTFDRVLCCGVLDFVRDPGACVRNLARHVAPGGRLVLMVPRSNLGGRVYGLWHRMENGIRVHLYSAAQLDAMARAAGLQMVGHRQPFFHSLIIAWERPAS